MALKVLVIDDDKTITTIIAKIASSIGCEVQALNDPEQALTELSRFQPDVVILDLVMPKLDGIDLMRNILATAPSSRLIVMTGFGPGYMRLAQGVASLLDCPQVGQLAKPFRRTDLLAALSRATDSPDDPPGGATAAVDQVTPQRNLAA